MSESRKSDRARSILGARLVFNNRNTTVNCQIRNISRRGAKLILDSQISLPDEFDVEVPQKSRVYRARLCWRDKTSVGVEFVLEAMSQGTNVEDPRVAQLQLENAALKMRVVELTEKLEAMLAATAEKTEKAA